MVKRSKWDDMPNGYRLVTSYEKEHTIKPDCAEMFGGEVIGWCNVCTDGVWDKDIHYCIPENVMLVYKNYDMIELSLSQIAEKFNIPVYKIRIKA